MAQAGLSLKEEQLSTIKAVLEAHSIIFHPTLL